MNQLTYLREHSHNIFAGVRGLFGYYCPLCKHRNIKQELCSCCQGLVLDSMLSHDNRCQLCMAYAATNHSYCQQCLNDKPSYKKLIAAFDYQPYGDLLIYKYKVQKQFWLAPLLSELLYQAVLKNSEYFQNILENSECSSNKPIVVPVPPSYTSLKKRGFNPPSLIAKHLARKLGLKYAPEVLVRLHNGVKQAKLSKEQRAINASYLYMINANIVGTDIIIVDDVFTTGSTINTISKQMLNAGANNIYAWVLARTPNKNKV